MDTLTTWTTPVLAAAIGAIALSAWVAGLVLLQRDRKRTRAVMGQSERDRRLQAVIDAAEAARSDYVGDGAQR